MTELIKIEERNFNNQSIQTVNARDLHEKLEVNSRFADWIKNRITKYDFIENIDYIISQDYEKHNDVSFSKILEKGGRPNIEYFISIDMAKELCMVENNEKGREIRRYFIECEKKLKEISVPQINSQFLLQISQKMAELENKIEQDKPLVDFATNIATSSNNIPIGDYAKIIFKEFKMGQNKLFKFLRDNEFLMNDNMPYQKYLDNDVFAIREGFYNTPYGKKTYTQTLVTGKGQIFLTERIKCLLKN